MLYVLRDRGVFLYSLLHVGFHKVTKLKSFLLKCKIQMVKIANNNEVFSESSNNRICPFWYHGAFIYVLGCLRFYHIRQHAFAIR